MDHHDEPRPVQGVRANTLTVRVDGLKGDISLDTFLATMRDSLTILTKMDRDASKGEVSIDWKVAEASYNSPLTISIVGIGRPSDRRPPQVALKLVRGMAALERGADAEDFSEDDLACVQCIAGRIGSKDGSTSVEFETPSLPPVKPTASLINNVSRILKTRYYHLEEAIEGKLLTINLNGSSRFGIYDLLTNSKTICKFDESKLEAARAALNKRVFVEGRVKYNNKGESLSVDVSRFEIMPTTEELPQFGPGQKINITDGVPAEEYIRRLRDAEQ